MVTTRTSYTLNVISMNFGRSTQRNLMSVIATNEQKKIERWQTNLKTGHTLNLKCNSGHIVPMTHSLSARITLERDPFNILTRER